MKRKITWLSVAVATFIVGVVSAVLWLRFPHVDSSNQQPINPQSLRSPANAHICLKSYDINLGDSFHYVSGLISLSPDPNGPNESIPWQTGKLTDFLSVSQESIFLDKDTRLNPSIFCTFDDQKRLRSFSISWLYDGRKSNSVKRKIIETLIEKEHTCMAEKNFDLKKSSFKDRVDLSDHVQEFACDFSDNSSFWSVSYSLEMK